MTRVVTPRLRATLATCPRCRRPVLVGIDDYGTRSVDDAVPITREAELVMFMTGRATHSLDRGELVRRDRWRIRRPATVVHAEHRCHDPIRPDQTAPTRPRPGHLIPDHDLEPPF